MREKKSSLPMGSGPMHLIWHALVVSSLITIIMIVLWTGLLSLQRMPTHDFNQLPVFFVFLAISIGAIASKVFLISVSSAVIALWLKCGTQHLFFYRITGTNLQTLEDLKCYLIELNFSSNTSNSWVLDNLLLSLKTDAGNWVLILRPRLWNPNLKVNKQLQSIALNIQEFVNRQKV